MFVQRRIFSLLLPIVYRHTSWAAARSVVFALTPLLSQTTLFAMIGSLYGIVRFGVTGAASNVALNSPVLQWLSTTNLIPAAVRGQLTFIVLSVGIIARLSLFASWFAIFPVVAGIFYVFTKEISLVNQFLVGAWGNLPEPIKLYIIETQLYVYNSLSEIINKGKPVAVDIGLWVLVVKTITYYGGWTSLYDFGMYLDTVAWIHNIYDNVFWTWLGNKIDWTTLSVFLIWRPLNWLNANTPIIDLIRWLFVKRDFFIIDWAKKVYRFIRRFI